MSAVGTEIREARQFVGGEWVAAANGRTFDDVDPFTGAVVAHVPAGGRDDARHAIETAAAAFPAWSETPPGVHQGIFLKAADALEARSDEVVSLLARETGCTFGFGMFQMGFVPNLLRQAAALPYAPLGEVIPSDTGAFAMGVRRPVGVVGERQINAGIVHVNDQPVGDEPQMPFGGVKDSGFGRFGGSAVVDEFTELRWITVQSGAHPFPF